MKRFIRLEEHLKFPKNIYLNTEMIRAISFDFAHTDKRGERILIWLNDDNIPYEFKATWKNNAAVGSLVCGKEDSLL